MSPDQFWAMTYRELCLALKGHSYTVERGINEAWYNAHLTTIGHHNPKKFPKLSEVTNKQPTISKEDRKEMKSMLEELTERRRKKLKEKNI